MSFAARSETSVIHDGFDQRRAAARRARSVGLRHLEQDTGHRVVEPLVVLVLELAVALHSIGPSPICSRRFGIPNASTSGITTAASPQVSD
jgi:hypothetical protein